MLQSYSQIFAHRMLSRANAWAAMKGGKEYPRLLGAVKFFQTKCGILVVSEFYHLPCGPGPEETGIFGFHIHEGMDCGTTEKEEFSSAKGHYNPQGKPHPCHAGDLPPIFADHGYAYSAFLTSRFTIREVMGRTVILHGSPDDFTTQPAGNAGKKIACGIIK